MEWAAEFDAFLLQGQLSAPTLRRIKNLSGANRIAWNALAPRTEFWDKETADFELTKYFKDTEWPPALESCRRDPLVMSAVGGLVWYLKSLKLDLTLVERGRFSLYDPIKGASCLILDGQTMSNLEILCNSDDGGVEGSLLELVNKCVTAFGASRVF